MSDPPYPRFLDERLAHWAETKPDTEAMTYLGRTWTWAEWNDRVRRLAGALTERGIKRGDVIAFLDKNHPACLESTFAAASSAANRKLMMAFAAPNDAAANVASTHAGWFLSTDATTSPRFTPQLRQRPASRRTRSFHCDQVHDRSR